MKIDYLKTWSLYSRTMHRFYTPWLPVSSLATGIISTLDRAYKYYGNGTTVAVIAPRSHRMSWERSSLFWVRPYRYIVYITACFDGSNYCYLNGISAPQIKNMSLFP